MNLDKCNLIKALPAHFNDYLAIRSEKENLYWTGYTKPPDKAKFYTWFKIRIEATNRDLYLFYCIDQCVGSLNIDYYSGFAYIGYSVKKDYTGLGIASHLIARSIEIIRERGIIYNIKAWVNENNKGSLKAIQKNNFIKSGNTEIRKRFSKDENYFEFILKI